MSTRVSRREFFARFRGGPPQIRPPWTIEEDKFVELCSLCNCCIEACPQQIIRKGHAGYPILDLAAAGCTFCASCTEVCRDGCFSDHPRTRRSALSVKVLVSNACVEAKGVTCRICESACDDQAISYRPALGGRSDVNIDAERCTGCGSCISACPVGAIAAELQQETANAYNPRGSVEA